MSYTPPPYNNIVIGSPEPNAVTTYNNIIIGLTTGIGRRALFLDNGQKKVIPDILLGTGVQPIVVEANGAIHPRIGTEGIPLVWLDSGLSTLPESDYLII